MTITPLSPSPIAAPVPGRYHTGDGDPPPTQSVSAAFDGQNADPSLQDHGSDPAHSDLTNAGVITQPSPLFQTAGSGPTSALNPHRPTPPPAQTPPAVSSPEAFRTPALERGALSVTGRRPKTLNKSGPLVLAATKDGDRP